MLTNSWFGRSKRYSKPHQVNRTISPFV